MALDLEVQSARSSLTSVFHDLLGDDTAKEVAAQEELVRATRLHGTLLVSRQQRETSRGDFKRFSVMYYHRLQEEEALSALRDWDGNSQDLEIRLSAAMYARVPIWHVVVDSIDYPGHQRTVSKYFMQNLEELNDMAKECLVEFLTDDAPSELQAAIQNPQFQDWCRQWYYQSEDVNDERSVRYICRLPGCAVLIHCIRYDFGECCQMLLDNFSDVTASPKWLVLAEPMRYFGKFQVNAFHEAAYCAARQCLDALISYGNHHRLPWKEAQDIDGKTVLDIARSQVERGKEGAMECFDRLQLEYGQQDASNRPSNPSQDALQDNVLLVDFGEGDVEPLERQRLPLPSQVVCWADLVRVSREAIAQFPEHTDKILVKVSKVTVEDSDEDDMRTFFQLWSRARSLSFSKCKFTCRAAPQTVLATIADQLEQEAPPSWERLYVFGALAVRRVEASDSSQSQRSERDQAEAHSQVLVVAQLRRLCRSLASNPLLPLWRLDNFPASLLGIGQRHWAQLLGAAMDVKLCAHQLSEDKQLYRYFWSRLVHVERRMLDRKRLLSDTNILQVEEVLDTMAVPYLQSCVELWMAALCGREEGNIRYLVDHGILTDEQHGTLVSELDNAMVGAMLLCKALPSLPTVFCGGLSHVLTPHVMRHLPATSRVLQQRLSTPGASTWQQAAMDELDPTGPGFDNDSKGTGRGTGGKGKAGKGKAGKGKVGGKGKDSQGYHQRF
ncbi:unnamed protein product [Polarella glacialis]|uniref:Uncharacterized protein n=1 Tax=Polarella glacialis TaxID=89957 RepID=A0A813I9R8_POLGL|nr:unnamed protein product [Polarella glacialis]